MAVYQVPPFRGEGRVSEPAGLSPVPSSVAVTLPSVNQTFRISQ